ncbi:MAG: GntR family transcriptional regulator [Dehalococcoidales bacterium]|nr:GntR family transcriptional regulator [Dehalococcoidales bacterium]
MASEPSALEPARSLAEQAYEAIREMILDLRMMPGQPVRIPELAERLGMSRTPVRQAIERLSAEGLIASVSRRGMVVRVPTIEAMRELYEIIEGIEGEAAWLAAQRADEALVDELEESVQAQEAALATDDRAAWLQADRRFHRLLIEAAGNRQMSDLVRVLDGQLRPVSSAGAFLRTKPLESVRSHRAVVEAIRQHDAEKARLIHLKHRDCLLQENERVYPESLALVIRASTEAAAYHRAAGRGNVK